MYVCDLVETPYFSPRSSQVDIEWQHHGIAALFRPRARFSMLLNIFQHGDMGEEGVGLWFVVTQA